MKEEKFQVGEKIKKLRKDKGLTLEELAKLTDSGKSYIWELEKEGMKPSAEKMFKIAQVLGVTVDYLLDKDRELPTKAEEDRILLKYINKLTLEEQFDKLYYFFL